MARRLDLEGNLLQLLRSPCSTASRYAVCFCLADAVVVVRIYLTILLASSSPPAGVCGYSPGMWRSPG